MTLASALFSYGPYFAVFGFLAARLYRWELDGNGVWSRCGETDVQQLLIEGAGR